MNPVTERSDAEQTTVDQPKGPWATPGPDAKWWHGDTAETPEVPVRRPSPAHRERPAPVIPAPAAVVDPPAIGPPTTEPPAIAALADPPAAEEAWPTPDLRAGRPPRTVVPTRPRRVRRLRPTRRPVTGLVALLLLGLIGIFFAWVSAEPLWLAAGHGTPGTATVSTCRVHGIPRRCADFTADGGTFLAERVALLGTGSVAPGTKVRARMVSATASAAYAGSVRVRCGLGVLGVLLCGFGVAWLTGAYRLPTPRARLTALSVSLAGPAVLTGVVLAATW
jgi:hypothetical protein